jgi:hypothetical protein
MISMVAFSRPAAATFVLVGGPVSIDLSHLVTGSWQDLAEELGEFFDGYLEFVFDRRIGRWTSGCGILPTHYFDEQAKVLKVHAGVYATFCGILRKDWDPDLVASAVPADSYTLSADQLEESILTKERLLKNLEDLRSELEWGKEYAIKNFIQHCDNLYSTVSYDLEILYEAKHSIMVPAL